MKKKTLLIEIGTEELPSRFLYTMSLCFYQNFKKELKSYNILYKKIKHFFTPRRLALKISDIDTSDRILKINKKGPSIIDAYDKDGKPTDAAKRWANYCGISIDQASHFKNKKGEWLLYQAKKKQEKIEILLPKVIETALKKIFIPKSMRWEITNKKFSRPIRNIVILLDNHIVQGKVFDIDSHNFLQNHLCYKEKKIKINNAQEYPSILFEKNNIIADYEIRKKTITKEINTIAEKINGFTKDNPSLLEEVSSLVESPKAFLATFEKKFLKIPKKILVYTIEKQQKCFSIYDDKKKVLPYFIFICNIHSKLYKEIILGYQRVMHARLSDAEFFFTNDRKIKLEDYLLSLKKVLFQNNLGSLYEKTMRLQSLIKWVAKYSCSDKKNSSRAALLSKCDLVTNMVCEFPELQGIVGMYYALEDQETKDIAIALKEQYLPSYSGDKLPYTLIGCSLSIADKIDTLSGMFSIGNIPTADKDPFALRRLAIGILRIIIEKKIPLDLKMLIKKSLFLYDEKYTKNSILYDKIINFFIIRLFNWYEEKGYNINIIKSVFSYKLTQPIDIDKKIQALSFFQKLHYSKSIILSIKRISNILEKQNEKISGEININLIKKTEEITLFHTIENFDKFTKDLFKEKKYKEVLLKTKELEKPIYNFFDKIKIYHSDLNIRKNRLILLHKIIKIFSKITNFSYLY
ncbi:MAG: glycine--tRNA ligase subunit beta [Buchnera aphidicola (Brevicoryne brassicae)]|uniref:Glycine--tRNA ligase beta subunit n=1 Tax=Buchnera aphidicola (Brevicoryne brassicae) TaxID=911343 RepID=A0AAJ5TXF4_9GAMM|nr:glycine--tRNA ligase subunit beta [Buchnera aphidicola]QCI19714.1 glycine--tRNA ligase subunit beta [Buchnera aphidicola (Brevicoryne brassicae)]WAI19083.1 MAG: glycine--tRNA ligase subunit beta [Buchnera aphidicola (Brevicoryne brassicae)]